MVIKECTCIECSFRRQFAKKMIEYMDAEIMKRGIRIVDEEEVGDGDDM